MHEGFMDRYPVVILDRPIRIFDFKPLPLLCLIVASLIALKISLFIDPTFKFGNMPANIFVFFTFFSLIAGNVKALELRPLSWWLKRIYRLRGPLPLYLPELGQSEKPPGREAFVGKDTICSSMRLNNSDLEKLDALQRLKIADLLVDFANDHCGSVQIYSPPGWMQAGEDRDFYLLSKESGRQFSRLSKKLTKLGLASELSSKEQMRRLIFGQLSPSHYSATVQSDAITSGDDLLSLCQSGFEHKLNYINIDGKFLSTLHIVNLPAEVNFGLFNKILDADCDLSFSLYLSSCDQPLLKHLARVNFRLGNTMPGGGPLTPPEHLAKIQTFCQTEMAATRVAIYVTAYADSLPELERSRRVVERAVHRMGGALGGCYAEELDAMITALPICHDLVKSTHTITSQAAAHFIPFL